MNLLDRLLGPLFRFEMTRAGRRSLLWYARISYVLLLLLALFVSYAEHIGVGQREVRREQVARFGDAFSRKFFMIQTVAIHLLVPFIVGSAIAEEKQRRTLDSLLASPLSNAQIILSKLFARLAAVLGVLLSGIPVLMLATFLGGIDPTVLLYAFAVSLIGVVSLGTGTMMLSVFRSTVMVVLIWTYVPLAAVMLMVESSCCGLGGAWLTPANTLLVLFDPSQRTGLQPAFERYLLTQGILTALALTLAVAYLRPITRPQEAGPPPLMEVPHIRADLPRTLPDAHRLLNELNELPVLLPRAVPYLEEGEDPILWKERHFASSVFKRVQPIAIVGYIVLMTLAFLYLIFGSCLHWLVLGKEIWTTFLLAMAVIAKLIALAMGWQTVGTIAGERLQQTLASLLLLPWDREELLRSKLRAEWYRNRVWLSLLALTCVLSLVVTHPVVGLGYSLLLTGYLVCMSTFALWLSLVCPTPMRATVLYLITWLLLAVSPVIGTPWLALQPVQSSSHTKAQVDWLATLYLFVAAGVYWVVGGLVWQRAVHLFECVDRD